LFVMAEADDVILNQPVVIDNGTGILKAGLAGGTAPNVVFPTFVGRPKYKQSMVTQTVSDTYVGEEAMNHRSILKLAYAMEHGVVTDWDDMEKIWAHLYSSHLQLPSEEHPVLLTEAPLNPLQNREKAAEIFFESFGVPALFFSMQAVLSLYASGRTTGVVMDIGDGVTHCVPVYEGFSMQNAITRTDIAGRDVTEYLQTLLRRAGHPFHTTAEREVVRAIKEKACYVSYKPLKDDDDAMKPYTDDAGGYEYRLPDNNTIKISSERYRAPEILFRPSMIGSEYPGVHEAIFNSISRCDLDMRKSLYSQVLLSGGSTMFLGFGDRLLTELVRLAPKDTKVRIAAPPERHNSTWIGGSILASLSTFKKMWTTKKEWNEYGASIVHSRTF